MHTKYFFNVKILPIISNYINLPLLLELLSGRGRPGSDGSLLQNRLKFFTERSYISKQIEIEVEILSLFLCTT